MPLLSQEPLRIGDVAIVETEFKVFGVMTDPTSIVLKFKKPDGTIVNASGSVVKNTSTKPNGVWRGSFLLDMSGTWWYNMAGIGNADGVDEDSFQVSGSQFD